MIDEAEREEATRLKIEAIQKALCLDFDSTEELMKLVDKQRGVLRSTRPTSKAAGLVPDKLASRHRKAHHHDHHRSKHAYTSVALKIQGLEPLIEGILKATYSPPTNEDSAEVRRRKMDECNFNSRLTYTV